MADEFDHRLDQVKKKRVRKKRSFHTHIKLINNNVNTNFGNNDAS